MKIHFLQTGGTIDKDYPKTTKGWAFEIGESAIPRILEKLNPTFEYELHSLLKKDSQEITDEDRQMLLSYCSDLKEEYLIMTHGTDTMIETGLFLSSITDKKIILTGAMRPERFTNSDADLNLGIAIGALEHVKNGVYIAMHGRVIPIERVKRNYSTGQFEK